MRLLLLASLLALAGCGGFTRLTATGARTDAVRTPLLPCRIDEAERAAVYACHQFFDGAVTLDAEAHTVTAATKDGDASAVITLTAADRLITHRTDVDIAYVSSRPNPDRVVTDLFNAIRIAPRD